MAGRVMCAGGSGPLFAPGTRRGRDACRPAGAPGATGGDGLGDWARGTFCGLGLMTAGIEQNAHLG
jgi:hypothetical protein